VNVEGAKPRILYIEGEPRWEFKFIRRAVEDDRSLELDTMLRTTQNKFLLSGFRQFERAGGGFPHEARGVIQIRGFNHRRREANYFSAAQQELIREFANRRAAEFCFWAAAPRSRMAAIRIHRWRSWSGQAARPQRHLPSRSRYVRAFPARPDSIICRLEEKPERNAERWKKMPVLADFQEVGEAKPGAVVLADVSAKGKRNAPLLVTENYGAAGRRCSPPAEAGAGR